MLLFLGEAPNLEMKVRYRNEGTKKYTFKGVQYSFDGEWKEIDSLLLFRELKRYPTVFDTLCFFDIKPFMIHADKIRFKKNLVFTQDKNVARTLEKIPFVVKQAYKQEKKEFVFRVNNYFDSDLRKFQHLKKIVKILIHRDLGGIGDVIMTTPVLEVVKSRFPNSQITYACPSQFKSLLDNNPFIDNLVSWSVSVTKEEYDVVVDLTRSCIKYEIDNQPNVSKNRTEVFLESCGMLNGHVPRPKLFLSQEEILWAKEFIKAKTGPFIGIVPESNAPVRQWHSFPELKDDLLKEYPTATLLEFCIRTPDRWSSHERVVPVFGKTLREVMALINECDIVVSPDTGIAHIASALSVPSVWIFTHIDGKVRTRNYQDVRVCQNIPKECSKGQPCWYEIPCGNRERKRELTDQPVCSTSISVSSVKDKIKEVLSQPNCSYLIIYHNGLDYTRECIDRVLKYKRWNDEVILIDNGSSDSNSFSKYPVTIIRNGQNAGCIKARNQALKKAKGRKVVFLDSDQWISPLSIHSLMSTEGDIVGVEPWMMDDEGYAFKLGEKPGKLIYVGAGGMLARKEVLESLNGFEEAYSPAWFEDPDICLRAREKGYKVNYTQKAYIHHLAHQTVNRQRTFDPKKAWEKSHSTFMDRWKGKINIPSIAMFVDVVGWAWEIKTRQILKYLKGDLDIEMKHLCFERPESVLANLFFTYDCAFWLTGGLREKKYLTGVTAHIYRNFDHWKESLQNAIAIHANSKMLYNEIKEYNDRVYYVPNGVDEVLFPFVERDLSEPFRVGYVGKPSKPKGLEDFIVPACKKAGVELIPQTCSFNSEEKIPHERMPEYYKNIDVIMIASISDGTPNMLLEAASTGRTFIGNRIGNVPEFVEEGINGFMLGERNVDDYVDRLLFLKKNRDTCAEMGREARKTIENSWTWKMQSENYRKMFKESLQLI